LHFVFKLENFPTPVSLGWLKQPNIQSIDELLRMELGVAAPNRIVEESS
jgi:hypothetical protein